MTKELAKNLLSPIFSAVNTLAGARRYVNHRCPPKSRTTNETKIYIWVIASWFLALAVRDCFPRNRLMAD